MSIYIKTKIYKQLYVIIIIVNGRGEKKRNKDIRTLCLCPCTVEIAFFIYFSDITSALLYNHHHFA